MNPSPDPLERLVHSLQAGEGEASRACLQEALGVPVTGLLLFGSRARGEEHARSDWDLVALSPEPVPGGLRQRVTGVDLDVDVQTPAMLQDPPHKWFYLAPARVLAEQDGLLAAFLAKVAARVLEPPDPMPGPEVRRWQVWFQRMNERIAMNLAEDPVLAACQVAWVLTELPGVYHGLRRRWNRNLRQTLASWSAEDPDLYDWVSKASQGTDLAARAEALREACCLVAAIPAP